MSEENEVQLNIENVFNKIHTEIKEENYVMINVVDDTVPVDKSYTYTIGFKLNGETVDILIEGLTTKNVSDILENLYNSEIEGDLPFTIDDLPGMEYRFIEIPNEKFINWRSMYYRHVNKKTPRWIQLLWNNKDTNIKHPEF